jgi:hypothetical protein
MGFTFNDFMHQVVQPVEHVITDPFTQATHNIQGATSTVEHSFDNIVNTAGSSLNSLGSSLSFPLLLLGGGAIALIIILKK